jgi:SAM-dependent methyltransferase
VGFDSPWLGVDGNVGVTVKSVLRKLASVPASYRSPKAHAAFQAAVLDQPAGAVCISVGGGPTVVHPRLINVNLAPFSNVHVVGDAYSLPLPDASIDAVYCEAVFEHLEHPERAAAEMQRVLKPHGQVLAVTPFLQPYHGYPDHFQNFTLHGHIRLLERAGFELTACGHCNGPSFAIVDLVSNYLREYLPTRLLSRTASYLTRFAGAPFVLFDRMLLEHPGAHMLASTTFVHARKPAPSQIAA